MLARQKQLIESYQRVQDFLANHPPPESPGYLVQKKHLDEVIASLSDHSSNQVMGRRLRHAEVPRQRELRRILREQHLAPLAQIARAILADAPGIEKALKMPAYNLNPLRLVAEAIAMRNAATPYEAQFIEAGRPADFLAQLDAAAEAVRQSVLGKARYLGRQVGARAGLEKDIKRGRRAVEIMDAIVKMAFLGDLNVLAEWRNARRVRALPVPSGTAVVSDGNQGAASVTPAAQPGTPVAVPLSLV